MIRKHLPILVSSLGSAVVAALLVTTLSASADRSPATDGVPRLIPYRGTLEQDGQPYDGGISMVFRIHDETDTLVFEELQQVQVFQGRFSVLLGSTGEEAVLALSRAVADADSLFLSIALRQGDAAETLLANRQRFLPVPYAFWTTASTDLHVGNSLSVAGHAEAGTLGVSGQASVATLGVLEGATVGGDLGVGGELSAGGDLVVGGDLDLVGRNVRFRARDGVGDGGTALSHGGGDILVINSDGTFRDAWVEGSTLTLVAPSLRFKRDADYLDALTLRPDGLYLGYNRRIPGGIVADGNFTVTGSMILAHHNLFFGAAGDSDGGTIVHRGDGDTLVVNASGTFAGGTRVESPLAVRGSVTVTNPADVGAVAVSTDANGNWLHLNQGGGFSAGTRVNGDLYSASSYMQGMQLWSSKLNSYVSVATWISRHCRLYFGHDDGCRDGCPGEGNNPSNWGWVDDGACGVAGDANGECHSARDEDGLSHRWLALQLGGDVNGDDRLFVGFKCVD